MTNFQHRHLVGLICLLGASPLALANKSVSYSVPIVIKASTANPAPPVASTALAAKPSAPLNPARLKAVAPSGTAKPAAQASIAEGAGSDGPLELAETTLEVAMGSQRILSLGELPARVALADPGIAEISVLKPVLKGGKGAGLLLVGKQAGSTSLLVWSRGRDKPTAYTLTVIGAPLLPLDDVAGLKVETKGNAVRLSGTVDNVAAYQKAKDKLAQTSIGGKPVDLTDNVTLGTSGTVQVDVKVVEFSRNDIQRLGINFTKTNGNLSFGFGTATAAATGTGAINQALRITYDRADPSALLTQLTALETEGVARVLAEPTLIAQSGQSASFLAGGEIPIPVPSGSASGAGTFTIQFKEFGIRLNFTPTILSKRTIALRVAPEVSDLDRNNGVLVNGFNIPAILTRRAETTVELGDGESFVIGGLISRNVTSNLRKFPVLADLPILGAFFRNVEYEKQDKELLIIATPRFVKPRAKNAPALPLPGSQAADVKPTWGQMFLPSRDGSLPGFSR